MRDKDSIQILPGAKVPWRDWPTIPKMTSTVIVVLAVLVLFGLFAPVYWTNLGTTAASSALLTASVGILFTRARMLALSPLSFSAIACWWTAWANVNGIHNYFIIIFGALVLVAIFGGLIGLLAIRLRGMYLAVATIAVAAGVIILLTAFPIPGSIQGTAVERPAGFTDDRAYFLFSTVIVVIAFVILTIILNSKMGTRWAMLSSERAAAAAGTSVFASKMSAFAISGMLGALSGVLLIGQQGFVDVSVFGVGPNLLTVVVAIFVGAGYVEGAVLSGLVPVVLGEVFLSWGVPTDIPTIFFGAGAVQALAENPGGLSATFRANRRKKRLAKAAKKASLAASAQDKEMSA